MATKYTRCAAIVTGAVGIALAGAGPAAATLSPIADNDCKTFSDQNILAPEKGGPGVGPGNVEQVMFINPFNHCGTMALSPSLLILGADEQALLF